MIHQATLHRRCIGFIWAALLCFLSTGCATEAVWDQAGPETASLFRLAGVRQAPDGKHRELLASYAIDQSGKNERYFSIPLDDQGLPDRTMVYAGKNRSLNAIIKDIGDPCEQRLGDLRLAVVPRDKIGMIPGQYNDFGAAGYQLSDRGGYPYGVMKKRIYVGGFRRSSEGELAPVKAKVVSISTPYGTDEDLVWPADCDILLLPGTQPRATGDLITSRIVACALTPLALAADAIYFPIGVLMITINDGW